MDENNSNKIELAPSIDLAAQVVLYRALGINKEFAMMCMAELINRRNLGEDFNFENFIDEELKKVPVFKEMDLVKITQGVVNNIKDIKK